MATMTKNESKRELIINGKILRILLVLSFPLVLNNVIISLYQIIDTFFARDIGDYGLSAIAFVTPIMGLLFAIGASIATVVSALVARNIGKKNFNDARKTVSFAIIVSMSVAVIVTVLGFIFAGNIIRGLGAAEYYAPLASYHFRYQLLSLPLVFFTNIYLAYKTARGETMIVLIVSLVGMITKMVLTIVLLNVFELGVLGLGLATLVSNALNAGIGVFDMMFLSRKDAKITLFDFKLNKIVYAPFILMMLPIMLERTSLSFSHIVVNMFITPFDPAVIAAYGLTNKFNTLIFMVSSAFGTALITIVGQNLAVDNFKKCKRAIWASLGAGAIITGVLLVFLYIFRLPLIHLFTDDPETIRHTIDAMNVFSHSAFGWLLIQVAVGVFFASGYTQYPIIISFLRLFIIRIPLLWLLLRFTNLGEMSIWIGMTIANYTAGIVAFVLMLAVKWEKAPKYLQLKKQEVIGELPKT